MAVRLTQFFAALAAVAWIRGVLMLRAVFHRNGAAWPDAGAFWTLIPLASAIGVLLLARNPRTGLVWTLTGACWGLVVLGMWSVGPFFAVPGVLLIAASVSHSVAARAKWRVVLSPLWLLLGATSLCPLFWMWHQAMARRMGGQMSEGEAIVWGTWMFVGLTAVLVIGVGVDSWRAGRAD